MADRCFKEDSFHEKSNSGSSQRAAVRRQHGCGVRTGRCVVWAYGAGSEAGCYLSGAHGKTSMYRVDLRRCVAADECERTSGIPL